MTSKELNELVERACTDLRETLSIKGDEYCHSDDRLDNFKDTARFNHCTPEKALWGFVSKHIIALRDFITDLEDGRIRSEAQILEKTSDIRAYMVLLEGLFKERQDILKGIIDGKV